MAQASALAIGSSCALPHGSAPVVQLPLRPLYRDCTRVQTHNQNMTVAASAIAERNTFGHLS